MSNTSPDEVLTPREVAQWLKTSRAWPYTMVARGLLPHFKMGTTDKKKLLRFRRGDLEEFLEKSRIEKGK